MIQPSGTFEYGAEFTAESFRASDIVVQGAAMESTYDVRLVGQCPMIRFWNDRVVIVSSEKTNSSVRNASFPLGNAVALAASPGDRLYVVRTGCGGIGLSLLRNEQLLLAIGAVTAVPLGNDVQVIKMPYRRDSLARHTWLECKVGREHVKLNERGISDIGNYQIYIESCWADGVPGTDECVAMSMSNLPPVNQASLRGAILLGNGVLKLTHWDCSEMVISMRP